MSDLATLVLVLTLVAAGVVDARRRVIPNRLTLAAAAAGSLFAASAGPGRLILGIGAAAAMSAPLLIASLVRPEGMGMGDVKLTAVIGLYLGWQAWPGLLIGLMLAALSGALIAVGRRVPPAELTLPLAPFLAAGVIPFALGGAQMLQ